MDYFFSFIAFLFCCFVVVCGIVFGVSKLNAYDTRETLRINNERCSTIAADAGAKEWKTNYEGECNYVNRDGKLQQVEVN